MTTLVREKTRDRVEVLFRLGGGRYLVELLTDPRWPDSVGKQRCVGGKIEPFETAMDALRRELREEYGLELDADAFAFVFTRRGPRGFIVRYETSASPEWIGRVSHEEGGETLTATYRMPDPWL